MPPHPRTQRVADRIQAELADILRRRLKDPRLGFLTVTSVEVSRDLHLAKVYVSVLTAEEMKETLPMLAQAKGFLRRELGRRLGLRHVPDITFHPDHSAEHGLRVAELLDELREQGEFDEEGEG